MEPFHTIATAAFYAVLCGLLLTAALTVMVRNLFHSAIALAFTLLGVAIVYFLLRADFLGGVQILLYVGAIMTLIIFAIMLTAKIADPSVPQSNRQRISAFILIGLLAVLMIKVIAQTPWNTTDAVQSVDAVVLGKALMTSFVFSFELISVVLLIALIGAIVISRGDQS